MKTKELFTGFFFLIKTFGCIFNICHVSVPPIFLWCVRHSGSGGGRSDTEGDRGLLHECKDSPDSKLQWVTSLLCIHIHTQCLKLLVLWITFSSKLFILTSFSLSSLFSDIHSTSFVTLILFSYLSQTNHSCFWFVLVLSCIFLFCLWFLSKPTLWFFQNLLHPLSNIIWFYSLIPQNM